MNIPSRLNGKTYVIQGQDNKGFILKKIQYNSQNIIYSSLNGYIVANSSYNHVAYRENGDLISLHIRHAECSDSAYNQFYHDSIVIINGTGQILGQFFFKELVDYYANYIIMRYKPFNFFRIYFGLVGQVGFSNDRFIMCFPTTYPTGIVLDQIDMAYVIQEEYLPINKIRSAIISYNFKKDSDAPFEPTQNLTEKFEPIYVMPLQAMVGDYITKDYKSKLGDMLEDARNYQAVGMTVVAISGMPIYVAPPESSSIQYVGADSSVLAYYVDYKNIDNYMEKKYTMWVGGNKPEAVTILERLNKYQKIVQESSYDMEAPFKVFWRYGAHIYVVMVATQWGIVAYPDVQYHKNRYCLGDFEVYGNTLDATYLPAEEQHDGNFENGLFIYGLQLTQGINRRTYLAGYKNGFFNLFECMPHLKSKFQAGIGGVVQNKYGQNIVMGKVVNSKNYIYNLNAETGLILKYEVEDLIRPGFSVNNGNMFFLYKNGDLNNYSTFGTMLNGETEELKFIQKNEFVENESKNVFLYDLNVKGDVNNTFFGDSLVDAYNGFGLITTDGIIDTYYFVSNGFFQKEIEETTTRIYSVDTYESYNLSGMLSRAQNGYQTVNGLCKNLKILKGGVD